MQAFSPESASNLSWQHALQQAFTDVPSLCSYLELKAADTASIKAACQAFGLRVPREFARRMQKGNPRCPLLLQVLPQAVEQIDAAGYTSDPLAERDANPLPGLLHKYQGRVLVMPSGHCAVHCRYCFRRHFAYEDNNPGSRGRHAIMDYIARDDSIEEVILSGGDPLTLNDKTLGLWLADIARIPHVTTCRLHTRLPIVIPQRITDTLLALFAGTRLQMVLVYHANHANEIDAAVLSGASRLQAANVTLLNQSVLLAGINDSPEALIALNKRLFAGGILPYYLHLCDKTQGTAHFNVSEARARVIMHALRRQCPGYLVPTCVREVPGEAHKVPMSA